MTFLQPWLLWALPVVLLPVIIHLLNRLRYRSVPWAAIMFLVKATRSSTRNARLRHYLLMACRMLILLLLVLAMSRPLAGGWLGLAGGGAADTVILLLDRSASMEQTDPAAPESKRVQALRLLARTAQSGGRSCRFVLIENVLRTPLELRNPAALESLALTAPTDTAADIPALFQAALDYIRKSRTGRTDIWVASDFQESNWRPDDRVWPALRAQLAGRSQDVRVFLLGFAAEAAGNRSVSLQGATRRTRAGQAHLALALDIRADAPVREPFPLHLVLNGGRSQVDVTMPGRVFRYTGKLALAGGAEGGGWGQAEIPADPNRRDNVVYFAYGDEPEGRVMVVAENLPAAGILRAAALAGASRSNRVCELAAPAKFRVQRSEDLALLVWQAAAPEEGTSQALRKYVEQGGALLCLPPGRSDKPGLFGLQWGRVETAPSNQPFRVAAWEENDGPLARTENGVNLPLSALTVTTRQGFRATDAPEGEAAGVELAGFADGGPFLWSRRIGGGIVFTCTTLPQPDWSSLPDGTVLVPMVQRMIRQGAARLGQARMALCGEWSPPSEQEAWSCVDAPGAKEFRSQAGVYQCGARRVALNRPPGEDRPEVVEREKVRALFGDVRIQFVDGAMARGARADKREIWYGLVCLALAALVMEALLLSGAILAGGRKTPEPAARPPEEAA